MFRSIMATLSKAGKDTYDSAARTLWYLNYGNIVEDYDDYREGEDADVESTVEHSDTEADESDDEHSDPQSGEERINTDEYESDDEDTNVQLVAEPINADEYEADDAIVQLVAEPIYADEYESDDADDEADAPERPPFIQEKISYRSWLPTLSTKWPYVSWKSNHTDLNGALVPYVRAPLQIEPVPVYYFNYPNQLTASRTNIYRLLNNRTMLQDLIYNGHLRLTPLPNIIPTQFLPVFQATLFGYSTQATVIRQLNNEYALQLGDLVLPLQDIQRALALRQNPTETTLVTTPVPAQPNLVSTGTPGLPNVNNLLIFRLFNGIYKVGLNSYNSLVEARDYYFNNEDIDDTIQESSEALNSSWLSKWPTLNRLMRRDTSKIVTINQHITHPSVKPETVFRPIVAEDTVRSESPRTPERLRSSVPFYSEESDTESELENTDYGQTIEEITDEAVDHSPSFEDSLAKLNNTIRKITDLTIRQKAIAVKNRLIALYPESDDLDNLTRYVDLTDQLLNAVPGDGRDRIAAQYIELATNTRYSHSPACQALGIAMMILGTLVTVLSTTLCITTGLAPDSALRVAEGLGLLAAGIGLFAYGRPRQETILLMKDLHADVTAETNEGLFSNANLVLQ